MTNEANAQAADTTAEQTAAAAPATEATKAAPKAKKAPAKKAAAKKPAAKKAKAKPAKKAAKAKTPKVKKDGDDDRLVPADLAQYKVDKEKKTAKGNPSVHCDDDVANLLAGKDLDKVYELTAKALTKAGVEGGTEPELRKRYKHLNVGMQRMNLGNRMRGALALAA